MDEYALPVPWSKSGISEQIHLKVLTPHFSKLDPYTDACDKLLEEDRMSRTTFYRLIKFDEFVFLSLSKCEKGLRETIRGLNAKSDPASAARRILLERELENHILR